MHCPNCSALSRDGARFCSRCGTALPRAAEQSARTSPQFCDLCGLPLPSSGDHFCEASESSRAAEPALLESERKEVTVVFADISESTKLISGLDPEAAWALLDPILRVMNDAVTAYGGTVVQIRGDGIMALIGAPLAQEDHAARGCYAAVRMHQLVDRLFDSERSASERRIRIHIGIATGEALVGTIGSDLNFSYNAVGEVLHIAARLQSLAQPGQTLCTQESISQTAGLITGRSMGETELRGVREPVKVVEVVGPTPTRLRFHASVARGLTPFLGRQREFQILRECLACAANGAGQLVELVGDAGIGKSRLVWEFTRDSEIQGWQVLEAGGIFYAGRTIYYPITRLLRQCFGIGDLDDGETSRRKVSDRLRAFAPDLDDARSAIMFLLDMDPEDPAWSAMDPPKRRAAVSEAFVRLAIKLGEEAPTVLVVEDLHWIDNATHALLDALVGQMATARVLLLVDYRKGHDPDWSHRERVTRLDLEPLSEASVRRAIWLMIGDAAAIAALGDRLVARAAGNPFFLEEMVKALAEARVLQGSPGAYRLAGTVAPFQVPSSVRAVLESRIDRLPAMEKRLLQAAAVVGARCSLPVLCGVLDKISQNLLYQHLLHLTEAGLLHEESLYPEPLYAFKHALIQEVVYEALPQERRRPLHAAVVRAIEQVYAGGRPEYAETLAYHAAQGEAWDKLAIYARQAGRKAVGQSAYQEAIRYFEEALIGFQRLPESEQVLEAMIETRFEMRNAFFPLGEIERDLTHLREAEKLVAKLENPSKLAWTSAYIARDLALIGRPDEAMITGRRALALGEEIGDTDLQIISRSYIGQTHYNLGEYQQSAAAMRVLLREIEPLAPDRRFGLPLSGQVLFRCWLIWALSRLGLTSEVNEVIVEVLKAAAAVDQPLSQTVARHSCGFALVNGDRIDEALPHLEAALSLCRRWRLLAWFNDIASCLGYAYARANRGDEGLELLEEAVRQSRSLGVMSGHAMEVAWLAEAQLITNSVEDAAANARAAVALARQYRERGNEAYALWLLGRIGLQGEPVDHSGIEQLVRAALDVAGGSGMQPLITKCHGVLTKLQQRLGDSHEVSTRPSPTAHTG